MATELPLPWTVGEGSEAYWVEAANGTRVCYCYFSEAPTHQSTLPRPSRAVARRLVERIVALSQIGRLSGSAP